MCLLVEKKKKKAMCLVQHISIKKPPTLFLNPIQNPPYY